MFTFLQSRSYLHRDQESLNPLLISLGWWVPSTLPSILYCCTDRGQAFRYLLDLPLEIRQQIYKFYLDSLPLTYPDLLPPLLLSSHQLHNEASITWRLSWHTAQFKFGGVRHLLRCLTSITHPTLCKLRHVSVTNHPLPLSPESPHLSILSYGSRQGFDIDDLLPLFPGLQLSTLTIYDPNYGHQGAIDCPETAYHALGAFVHSQGWKELIYFVPRDWPLRSAYRRFQLPQPSTWDALIKQRDGIHSGAGVQIFGVDTAKRRTPISFTSPTSEQETSDGDERYEQVEVRLTRGRDVKYVQESGKCNSTIEYLFKKYTWENMPRAMMYVDGAKDPTHWSWYS